MSRAWQRLHEERGQTLVFFVVTLTALVVLLAFVVDVGAWLGTKRKLQSVADAAAVAAVQTGAGGYSAIDDGWATLSPPPPGGTPPDTFTVTATHEAPIIFGSLAGITGFDEKVTATAQAVEPPYLDNRDLLPPKLAYSDPGKPPYVAPIFVNQCIFDMTCGSSACFGGPPGCTLNFDATDAGGSLFGLAELSSSGGPNRFRRWVTCQRCYMGQVPLGATYPIQSVRVSNPPTVNAMNNLATAVPPTNLLAPVYTWNPAPSSTFNVVGFSRFVLTGVVNWQAQGAGGCTSNCKVITGYFVDYTLPSSFGKTGGSPPRYGVRAVGLTS